MVDREPWTRSGSQGVFSPKAFQQAEVGGQDIHQEAVKLSAGHVVELPGNLAGQQLDPPKSHWEGTSRGAGAVTLISCLGVPQKDHKWTCGGIVHGNFPNEDVCRMPPTLTRVSPMQGSLTSPTTEARRCSASKTRRQ